MSFGETTPPVVRHLLLCQHIGYDLDSRTYSLHDLITALEPGGQYPLVVDELWVFVQAFGEPWQYYLWFGLVRLDEEGEDVDDETMFEPVVLIVHPDVYIESLGALADVDQTALAADVSGLIQALSEAERDLGGGGLTLADQRAEPNAVILTLGHAVADGAAERAAKLAAMLNGAVTGLSAEKPDVVKLLGTATGSPEGRVRLLVAGSPAVLWCEVLSGAA